MGKQSASEPGTSMIHGLLPAEEMLETGRQKKKLIIGIPSENHKQEHRIPLTPEAVELLVNNGHEVYLQKGAGEGANYIDNRYSEKGALIVDTKDQALQADIILKIAPLTIAEIDKLKGHQTVFTSVQKHTLSEEYIRKLMAKKVTAISFETIKDAYNCYPVVRSLSAIAGSTAILIAGELLKNDHEGKGVLLGGITGITPAEVIIIGAGTAAEFAARAALGLGCLVKVFDHSVHKMERLQRNLNQRIHTSIYHPQVLEKSLKSADVVIGAMNMMGKRHRLFVSEEMVKHMKKNAIIIDISIDQGGCIETSECRMQNNPLYKKHGVIHYCSTNLTSVVARTASIALSNVISPIMLNLGESGGLKTFLKDSVGTRNGVYIYNGILVSDYIGSMFNIPSKDIELLMAAF